MSYLFSVTLFISAALLFCVEPLVAKMVLPLLGGSPAVWNTCLVFFQAALLAGYLYAHTSAAWLGSRGQVLLHLGLLALAALVLPIDLSEDRVGSIPYDVDPVPWLLANLARTVGPPFFVMAASAPLLQIWFAGTRAPGARDPYFLYAASNLGSMIALLGYPLALEPVFTLQQQSVGWGGGYGLLLLLTACCAIPAWREPVTRAEERATEAANDPRPTALRCLRWVVLSLVPSSLLLGVTAFVTTDVAAIPLLWVIPLALYLLTFILVFAQKELIPQAWMVHALPVVALLAVFTMLRATSTAVWVLTGLHWTVLFVAAMVCHGELAKDRPAPRYLTGYYLWISVGGVLGGLLTAFVAPLLFRGSVLEYPLMIVAACLLRPGPGLRDSSSGERWLDLLVPGGVAVLCLGLLASRAALAEFSGLYARAILFGLPALACWFCAARPTRFALSLAVVFFVFMATFSQGGRTILAERNFFGIIRVQDDPVPGDDGSPVRFRYRVLNHGSTEHGLQRIDDDGNLVHPAEALAYFHDAGPVGDVFPVFRKRCKEGLPANVAITGLGVGALASYARPGDHWTFYEIDPAMERAAREYFSFLADCEKEQQVTPRVVLGDARLRLKEAQDHEYGLIVLDAFSSDSVPAHLISRQALKLYRSKLAPGGLLLFNVSNRYLDLKRVLAALAEDGGMVCYYREHSPDALFKKAGTRDSQWVVMADRTEALGAIASDPRSEWKPLARAAGDAVWTDDFSNVLGVFKWRGGNP